MFRKLRKQRKKEEGMLMFQKQRKKLICFVLFAAVLVSGNSVSAAVIGQDATGLISIQSVNIVNSNAQLNISDSGTANMSVGIAGKAGISKIQMTIKLQKYNSSSKSWKNVKSWEKTVNSANASFSTSYKLDSKGTYRCKVSASVWKNGSEETINLTSVKKTY